MLSLSGTCRPVLPVLLLLLTHATTQATAENLARGRSYTWSRPPHYVHCTDPADSLQLTDGRHAAGDPIWVDRASVGWELFVGDIVTWMLDLGSLCELDSVVLSTAWFERSEVVPPSLVCAVGNGADRFAWAGAVEGATLARADSTRPARVTLEVPLSGLRGRWILIAAQLRGPFLFVDEIEVHGSRTRGTSSVPIAASPGNPLGRFFEVREIDAVFAVQRRVWAMRRALGSEEGTPGPADTRHERRGPEGTLDAAEGADSSGLDAAAASEEEALLAARARAWRAAGLEPMTVRRVDPWAPTTPWSNLQPAIGDTLELWPGAWGAAAIELAVAGDRLVQVPIRLPPAEAGAPQLELREVVNVESRDGRWAGDALPRAPATLAVLPGSVRQVWIDVEAREATPGTYLLQVEVGGRAVPLPIRVHDVSLQPASLAALNWTYPTKFALTRQLPEVAVRDNREHGIHNGCLSEESVPWPDPAAFDAEGRLTAALDFTACDRDLAFLDANAVQRILWYWDFQPRSEDPSGGRFRHPYLSGAWCRAVSEWLEAWLSHLEARGYDRQRIVMQPVDETSSRAVQRLYRTLHQLHPDLPLALTLTRKTTSAEVRALESSLALAIVERRALPKLSPWIARAQQRGVEVWVYDVPAPSKVTSPVDGYRLLPWLAWAHGLSGCGFWAYGDTGLRSADAWDDFDGARWDFAVVYGDSGAPRPLAGEGLVPSKRWQAFRMGLQDTALLAAVARQQPELPAAVLQDLQSRAAFDPESERRRLLRRIGRESKHRGSAVSIPDTSRKR
jgi:hypothetical protein